MGRQVEIPGFSSGIVDEKYLDRLDNDAIRQSLRTADNFYIGRAGEATVRPGMRVSSDWNSLDSTITPDQISFASFGSDAGKGGTSAAQLSYIVAFVRDNLTLEMWYTTYDPSGATTGTWTKIAGTYSWKAWTTFEYVQFGNELLVTSGDNLPILITNDAGTITAAEYVTYTEKTGLVQTAHLLDITNLTAGYTPSAGEVLSVWYVDGTGVTGESTCRVIELISREAATVAATNSATMLVEGLDLDVLTWAYYPLPGPPIGRVVFAEADAATNGGVIVDVREVIYAASGEFTRDYDPANDRIRIAGADYVIGSIINDEVLTLTTTIDANFDGHIKGVHHAKKDIDTNGDRVKPHTVTVFQGRIVFGNYNFGSTKDEGMRLTFSALYDPQVIRPAAQLQPDASSPIDIKISSQEGSSIMWIEGGDTLFVGSSFSEYALQNPDQLTGATAETLPVFRPTGTYGSDESSAHAVFDGRIYFASRNGGGVLQARYSFEESRYNFMPVDALTQAGGNATHLAMLQPNQYDAVHRMFVLDADGSIKTAAVSEGEGVQGGWTNITHSTEFTVEAVLSIADRMVFVIKNSSDEYSVAEIDDDGSTYALDLPTSWSGGFLPTVYRGAEVAYYGTIGTEVLAGGIVAVAANGSISDINTEFSDVYVGLPINARLVTSKFPAEDFKGSLAGRRKRIVSARVSHSEMRQYYVNNQLALQEGMNLGNIELPAQDGASANWFFGYSTDPAIEVSNMVPYRGTIRSINLEVAG